MLSSNEFEDRLSDFVGDTSSDLSLDDEHVRWRIYDEAIASGSAWRELAEVLALEPVLAVASSAFLGLVEGVEADDREAVAAVAASAGRDDPGLQQRVSDLLVSERVAGPAALEPEDVRAVLEGSDWLQRRVSERSSSDLVLSALETSGRTKRVRRTAKNRLG